MLMLNRGLRRLTLSLDEIRAHSREMAEGLLNSPFEWSPVFDAALKEVVKVVDKRSKDELADIVSTLEKCLASH